MQGMRLSVVLLVLSLAGVLGGGALAEVFPVMGGCLIFDSLCVGAWALVRDDGLPGPQIGRGKALAEILEAELRRQ